MRINSQSRVVYMGANYSAYLLNFISGLILARKLGPEQRGVLAYVSSFYLLTLLLVPMNSRNGSSLAALKSKEWVSYQGSFPFKKLYFRSIMVAIACTLLFAILLAHRIDTLTLVVFSISNLACGLTFYIYFSEGIFRASEKIFNLAVLRFLGLAVPSIYVFILYAFDKLQVNLVLLSQFFALLSCFLFLRSKGRLVASFDYANYVYQVRKTYLSSALEYIANFLIYFSVILTGSEKSIGLFVIAVSLTMVSETFFPLVESRMFKKLESSYSKDEVWSKVPLLQAIKEMVMSQILFIPLAFAIPFIYGADYQRSVEFAIILIIAKCNFSIVKLCCSFSAIVDSFELPVQLNTFFLISYSVIFCGANMLGFRDSWQWSSIVATSTVALLSLVFIKKLRPDHSLNLPANLNATQDFD